MRYGNRLVCDCCGRQIVQGQGSDEYVVPVGKGIMALGCGKHACCECAVNIKEEEQGNDTQAPTAD